MPDGVLPKTYRGPVPEWPLLTSSERELELWAEMWRLPQAAIWVPNAAEADVAIHVRTLVEIEDGRDGSATKRLAHRQAVALLLTPTSPRRAGYRVSPVEPL